jgi:hypothetical protein
MRVLIGATVLISLSIAGCSSDSPQTAATPAKTYADPFAYCAAVGTIDQPGAAYVGPSVPDSVAEGLKKAVNGPADAPLEVYKRATYWRCMDGHVYACTVGANLPCEAKADTNRSSPLAVSEYCQRNPNSETVPMVVTGRETVYEWRCTGGNVKIVRQFATADARGFISNIWYRIGPGS